jgi:hypothetical protein
MEPVAVLTPAVLLLLMVLLGRLERWLDAQVLPPPPRDGHRRWRTRRPPRSAAQVGTPGRRPGHPRLSAARRRTAAAVRRRSGAVTRGERRPRPGGASAVRDR